MTQQQLTPHQSQYFAWLLTRRAASDSVESLASTLVDAEVDLNPHQIEAALFACQNPLSNGVILADEVGLGKTIEAGLVISQRWAERQQSRPRWKRSYHGRKRSANWKANAVNYDANCLRGRMKSRRSVMTSSARWKRGFSSR